MATVKNIYETALGLMSETPEKAKGYAELVIPVLNELLAECFDQNNASRINDGLEQLEIIPEVAEMSDLVDYQPMFIRVILPEGLAARLLLDDDMSKAGYFDYLYNQHKKEMVRAVPTMIEDVY